ncbi:MAG: cache domain-containing protein [Desulforhopalus sp.]|nr:cache domain-containing protein [Desulforhopalus sp.]
MSLLKQISESFRFRIVSSFLLVLLPALIVLAVAVQYFFIPSMRQGVKEELANSTRVLTGSMRASAGALIRNHLKAIAEKNREIAGQHLSLVDQGLLTREEAVKRLRAIFLSQQIGSSGYIYCLDHNGNVPIHPNKDVENTDVTGFQFVREQLKRKEGYIEYDWQNPGEQSARPKALYMVYFEPLDWIISVSSYRAEFNELLDLQDFRDAVTSLKFGKSGYAYVFNKEGKVLLHPVLGYLTDLSTIDAATESLKPMLTQDSGIVEYEWRNPEEPQARKKIAVFESVPEYGWIVVSSAYLEEVMAPVDLIVRLGYIAMLAVVAAVGLATFLLSGRLSRPIDAMLHQLDDNTKSGIHKPLPTQSNDEIGRLAQEFNNFFTVIHSQGEQLRKERERYQSLFETSPDAVFLMQGMKIIDCNPATCEIFAGTREAILGRSVVDLSPPFQGDNISSALLAEKITGQLPEKRLQAFDWVHKTVDGRLFDAEVRLKPFGDDDDEMLMVAFVRDITKRKRAEEALLLTQFIFDKASVGIFRSGADARILNVNEQACKSLGYTREELCQLSLFDIDPALSPETFKGLREKRVEHSVVEFESLHRSKNGYVFPVHISSNLLEYQGEQFSISFVRDITEEKNNEKQKAIMEAHLQQAQRMEALGTLAGGVAHDFNNILTAIIGYTDLTKLASHDNPQIQAYLVQLQSASLRAKNLVKQILSFSKQGNLEKRPIDISQVLHEALDLFKGSIPSGIELHQHIQADLGTVIANETQIHQVIMNLCTNACHAMGKGGGRLEIDLVPVSITDRDAINYPDLTTGQYLKLVVIDTGHGITADDLANIFEPYFTTKPMGEGTGLGLSTVHGIVKDHGGGIKVYSEVHVGTTFQIFLPLVESESETSLLSESELLRGTETILYVDDEKYLIDLGKELLEGLGYTVETRASSLDAWEAFQVHPGKYDLVITDMTMPQLSGMELAMKILEIQPDMLVILCTGFSTRLNAERLKGIGVKKVLMKPVTLMELSVAVREVLDEAKGGHTG